MSSTYSRAITTLADGGDLPDGLAAGLMHAMMTGELAPPEWPPCRRRYGSKA